MSGRLQQLYNPMQSIGVYEKTNRAQAAGNSLQAMMNPQATSADRHAAAANIADIAPDEAMQLETMASKMDDRQRQETAQQYEQLATMMQGIEDEETWNHGLQQINAEFARQGKPPINVGFNQREGLIARVLGMKQYFEMQNKARDDVRQGRLVESQIAENYAQAHKAMGGGAGDGGNGSGFSPEDPIAPQMNVYGGLDSIGQRQVYTKQLSEYNDINDKYREAANNARKMKAQVSEFVGLNAGQTTGGLVGGNVISDTVRGTFDSDYGRMMSIMDEITPLMRQGMPGAASDRDVAMFRGATVGTGKRYEANIAIAKAVARAADNVEAQQQFFDWYFQKYRTVVGADAQWTRYNNANPIFNNDDPAHPVLNEARKDWRTWVAEQQGGKAPAGGQPQPQTPAKPAMQFQPYPGNGAKPGTYAAPPHIVKKYGDLVKGIKVLGNGKVELLDEAGDPLETD